ncbi:MAG: T9SS type A sorting domain-containing protein [Bacteroidales bacterium]|nr:T9SS type A sorting domain-containing protein [Bacteroidales bacterium]
MRNYIRQISLFLIFAIFSGFKTPGDSEDYLSLYSSAPYFAGFSPPDTAQIWPKIYGGNLSTGGDDVDETYDQGYLITGNMISSTGLKIMGILLKTDVNGNMLWEKRVGSSSYFLSLNDSYMTSDGGLIMIGTTMKLDEYGDAFIVKLDACGNTEWCKIYSVPDDLDSGVRIIQLSDGKYVAQINYFGYDNAYKRVWLFCLNHDGDLLWQKVYCTNNPELAHSWGFDLIIASDSSYIVSGTTTVEWPIGSGLWWGEPLLIKSDKNGEELFAKAFQYDKNIYYGLAYRVAEDINGNYFVTSKNYYDSILHSSPGALVKFDSNGNGLNWMNLWAPMYWGGTCSTVDFISPDTMLVTGGFVAGFDSAYATAYIMDTSGQVLNETVLKYDPDGNVVTKTILTSNSKALMTATFWNGIPAKCDMYLFKMDYNLEYDTMDPRVLTYDSLCPNLSIVSDTIDPDCDIIVGLEDVFEDPDRNSLKIIPNPAREKVTISLPEVWLSEYSTPEVQIQTAKYTFPKNLHIEVFDSFGRFVYSLDIPDGNTSIIVHATNWKPGLYIVRLLISNQEITSKKVIIN